MPGTLKQHTHTDSLVCYELEQECKAVSATASYKPSKELHVRMNRTALSLTPAL